MLVFLRLLPIGNAHADYPVAPELAFDILEEINHSLKTIGASRWFRFMMMILEGRITRIAKINIGTRYFLKMLLDSQLITLQEKEA